jgi:hypothetical protein
MSADLDPNAIYRQMSDDELAEMVISLKEEMSTLRTTCWRAEDELRNRLIERNAKRLQGEKFLVKSSVKREIKWNDDLLDLAAKTAGEEGVRHLFDRAFPLVHSPSIRNLNELLKFGGKTAEAVEAAKSEVNEKIELAYVATG